MNMMLEFLLDNIILIIKTILYILFILMSGYFAGIETALLRYSSKKISINDKLKDYINIWETKPGLILSSILIGTNISCAGVGVIGESLGMNVIYSIVLLLVFGEIFPKVFALSHGQKFLSFGLKKLVKFSYVTYPLGNFLVNISGFILSFLIGDKSKEEPFLTQEELKELILYEKSVSKEEQQMYKNVIELANKRIYEIMIPKEDIVAVNYDLSMEKIISELSNIKFSRVPVYKGNIDNIVGIIYTKDVTVAIQNRELFVLDDIIREPYFVINTAKVVDILRQFRQGRHHLAIVVDEYGAVVGLVTIEDIIEELFGEIYDEYDIKQEKIKHISGNTFIIDGDETLENIRERLKLDLFLDIDVASLSGYIITKLGYVPKIGEIVKIDNIEIEILDATFKVIRKVKLTMS